MLSYAWNQIQNCEEVEKNGKFKFSHLTRLITNAKKGLWSFQMGDTKLEKNFALESTYTDKNNLDVSC